MFLLVPLAKQLKRLWRQLLADRSYVFSPCDICVINRQILTSVNKLKSRNDRAVTNVSYLIVFLLLLAEWRHRYLFGYINPVSENRRLNSTGYPISVNLVRVQGVQRSHRIDLLR